MCSGRTLPGGFPPLLQRTPYDKGGPGSRSGPVDAIRGAMNGYVVVIQDVRGRHSSDGEFYTFVNEADDGYHSVEWVAAQPWCNARWACTAIPTWAQRSGSPQGKTPIPGRHRPRASLPPTTTKAGPGRAAPLSLASTFPGPSAPDRRQLGQPRQAAGPLQQQLNDVIHAKDNLTDGFLHLPLEEVPDLKGGLAPYYYDWLAHPEFDDYWKSVCIAESHSDIDVPALNWGGWYDVFLGGTIDNYVGMRRRGATEAARKGQRLLIGPWIHGNSPVDVSGQFHFGTRASSAVLDLPGIILRYYDHWLKGEDNGVADEKPVRIFVMGENRWRMEDQWPWSGRRPPTSTCIAAGRPTR